MLQKTCFNLFVLTPVQVCRIGLMFKTPAGAFAAQTSVGRAAATPPDPENWVGRAVFPCSFNWPLHFLWFIFKVFSFRSSQNSFTQLKYDIFILIWDELNPPPWGRVERDRAEWKSFQKSEIRRLNPTFLKTFKCCIPYSVQAIFGFWRCENTEYLFRKYVEYLPNFRANFQKQFSGESAVDADWRGEGAVNCGWKTGGKLEVRSLTPQIHPVVQRNMEINFYFTLYRQWTRLSKWNWVWNCWCSCFWHRACLWG